MTTHLSNNILSTTIDEFLEKADISVRTLNIIKAIVKERNFKTLAELVRYPSNAVFNFKLVNKRAYIYLLDEFHQFGVKGILEYPIGIPPEGVFKNYNHWKELKKRLSEEK